MDNPPLYSGAVFGRFARLTLFAASALFAFCAIAAPVSIDQVQKLAGGVASSVQISYATGTAVKMAQAVSSLFPLPFSPFQRKVQELSTPAVPCLVPFNSSKGLPGKKETNNE